VKHEKVGNRLPVAVEDEPVPMASEPPKVPTVVIDERREDSGRVTGWTHVDAALRSYIIHRQTILSGSLIEARWGGADGGAPAVRSRPSGRPVERQEPRVRPLRR